MEYQFERIKEAFEMIQSQIVILGGENLSDRKRIALNQFDVETSDLANKAKKLRGKLCLR